MEEEIGPQTEEENGPPGRLEAGRRGEAYSPKRDSGRCYGKNRIKNVLKSLKIGLGKGSASFCRVPGGGVHAGSLARRTKVKNGYKIGKNSGEENGKKSEKQSEKHSSAHESEKHRPDRFLDPLSLYIYIHPIAFGIPATVPE